jgi:phosphatidylserine decarboxylase
MSGFRDGPTATTLPAVGGEWSHRLALGALRRLPVHALSRLAGRAAGLHLPGALQRAEIRAFGAAVGVDFDEVRDPIGSFASLQSFFTRALVDGARPIDSAPDALVAPSDGAWGASGRVEGGTLLQLKGRPYSVGALLGDDALATAYEGGAFATFYLSPRDYHRFHAPCDLHVRRAVYIPGTLWPVNRLGVEGVDALFAQNERICAFAAVGEKGGDAGEQLCLVAVGATLVGRIRMAFDDTLASNEGSRCAARREYTDGGHALVKGAELGRFEFGSTLVLLAAPGLLELDETRTGTPLRLGRRIGTLRSRRD